MTKQLVQRVTIVTELELRLPDVRENLPPDRRQHFTADFRSRFEGGYMHGTYKDAAVTREVCRAQFGVEGDIAVNKLQFTWHEPTTTAPESGLTGE